MHSQDWVQIAILSWGASATGINLHWCSTPDIKQQATSVSLCIPSIGYKSRKGRETKKYTSCQYIVNVFCGSATPCVSPPPRTSIYSHYSFWSTTLLTGMTGISLDAMASDFSVAWQCLSKRIIGFFVTDQTPCPYLTRSLPAQLWHRCTEWSTEWVSTR
jgi:hypothetical protein